MLAGGAFQVGQGFGSAWFGVDEGGGDEVREGAYAVDRVHHESCVSKESGDADFVEAAGHRVRRPPAPVRVLQGDPRLGEMSGESARQHDSVALGNQETEYAALAQYGRHRLQSLSGIIDNLEHTVTEHGIGTRLPGEPWQLGGITLNSVHELADTFITGATLERSQCIRTRVDDRDPVPFHSKRYGEPAGAAAEIDDVQSGTGIDSGPTGQCDPQSFGDQRRTYRGGVDRPS